MDMQKEHSTPSYHLATQLDAFESDPGGGICSMIQEISKGSPGSGRFR